MPNTLPTIGFSLLLKAGLIVAAITSSAVSSPLTIDISTPVPALKPSPVGPGTTKDPQGREITVDSRSLRLEGQPFVPVCGEFHYSRYPRSEWRDELLKMKAGGVDIVSTYVFWIHHEEERGIYDWSGDRSLRDFLKLCQEVGLKAIVRLGPYSNGETRNGGFPDWVQNSGTKLRSSDPAFLALVKPQYEQIAKQLEGLLWKDGGPVIGVQLENEKSDPAYLLTLKKMAQDAGIDVPLYTLTGWNGVSIPKEGLLPLFGAYSDGFWSTKVEKFRKSFLFSPVRDDGDLGAQMVNIHPGRIQNIEAFPFVCCEIGSGMASSYKKRVKILPDDIGAMSLCKLGSGNNMPGYYMYQGGINPDGKLTPMNEDKPTTMPVKDYDFQAPLGAAGEVREQFHLLRELHLFLQDFGDQLAPMPVYFPKDQPKDLLDVQTLRWSMRADDKGSGFLFFNNYQPIMPMSDKADVQFAISAKSGSQMVPAQPLTIPTGAYGFWPIRLDCDGVHLDYATVQPLGRIVADDGSVVYFFVAIGGVRPEIALEGKAPQIVTPGTQVAVMVKNSRGNSVQFVVLTPEQGRDFYRAPFDGQSRAILSKATVLADGNDLRLLSEHAADFQLALFPPATSVKFRDTQSSATQDGIFSRFNLTVAQPFTVNVTATLEKPAGPKAATLNATDESTWADAASYHLAIPTDADGRNLRLEINYIGDAARIYVGDKLIFDNFYNGNPVALGFWRIPKGDWRKLSLKVLPYSAGLDRRLPPQAQETVAAATASGALDKVTVTAMDQLEARISP